MTIKPLRVDGIDPFPPRIPIKIWGEILHPTYEITVHPYDRLNPSFFALPVQGLAAIEALLTHDRPLLTLERLQSQLKAPIPSEGLRHCRSR